MKHFYTIAFVLFVMSAAVCAQHAPVPMRLKNGNITGQKNLQREKLTPRLLAAIHFKQHYYIVLQFDQLPDATQKKALAQQGISLSEYIPDNAFMAEISDAIDLHDLGKFHITGAYPLDPALKISKALAERPENTKPDPAVLIAVNFFGNISKEEVMASLQSAGATIVNTKIQPEHVVFVQASATVIQKMARLPFVAYITEQVIKASPLNYFTQGANSLSALSSPLSRNLHGRNVAIGVGDNGDPSTHVDFTGRLINRNPETPPFHGTHTTGTVGGGGLLNEKWAGMASQSTLISQFFTDILTNATVYVNDYGMVLTNNSYSASIPGCSGEGEYDNLSNYADKQMNSDTALLHVFAAGNDGWATCAPYPVHYGTVKSGFQSSKNPIQVGAIDNVNYLPYPNSSRGPVKDGRVKPELMAGGINVFSTTPNNTYSGSWGTSMAAPGVTGSLALLYERYRQLHGGANPSSALIKAVACNGADDLGNPGPDYTFGFGKLNARTAVEMIENNQYVIDAAGNGSGNSFVISGIPPGTYQVRVMLYWNDPAAAPYAGSALVNDLDLTVTSPDAIVHRPLVLDPTPSNVNNVAKEGIDNLNNIEQVVITNPPAGNFTVTVKGTRVPSGPQKYVVVYQLLPASVIVEYPFGNEKWVSGEQQYIRWNAWGSPGPFKVDYSTDNGASWIKIADTTGNIYVWDPPAITTVNALIRVTDNTTGYSGASKYRFAIMQQPSLSISNPCQGYAQLSWNTITSATSYEVMLLRGDSMRTLATTAATNYMVSGLSKDSGYWLSVRPVINTTPGRRSVAVFTVPNSGACTLPAFNNDLAAISLTAPRSGRMYTSSQLGNETIKVNIKNLGSVAAGPFSISYQVNGGSIVTETNAAGIAAATAINYSFTAPCNFSAAGLYTIKIWVDNAGDPQHGNDTVVAVIKQLNNAPLTLSSSYTETFETGTPQTYTSPIMGLEGLDRCDFNTLSTRGRLRAFINTGIARSGNRCLSLDQVGNLPASSADSATVTFNLSNYTSADQIWLDFYYRNHGIDFVLPGNKVWIRGNDQAAWIPAFTFPVTGLDFASYKLVTPINVTEVLASAIPAQAISSSFQVRFGQEGYTSTNSVIPNASEDDGFSIDDVTLTHAVNDAAVLRIVTPDTSSICSLSTAEPISILVKNYSAGTLTNVPVSYNANSTTVTEIIPSLAPGQQITYKFMQGADLSAYKTYTVRSWVSYPGDNYHKDDTATLSFITTPVISAYPYLEGFESDKGHWYTGGANSTWQWGTPAKPIIKRAANGTHAWVTNLTGPYNNNELSYLYSPCFDLTGLTQPVLSFSHIFRTEDDCDCDYHWVEYTEDNITWKRLGAAGAGTNWYDNATTQGWQLSDTVWHVSSIDIPVRSGRVRFRIVMSSDPGVNYEGIGIDDIHVFDKKLVYAGADITSGLSQSVSGNNWIDFNMGGNRVVSIHPHGQNLGATEVRMYNNTGPVRYSNRQYYLDRNIVVQPANVPAGNISVRFYFLNTEVKKLTGATGCASCAPVTSVYNAGVTQYSDAPAEENGNLADDVSGHFYFMAPHTDVSMIPYDNGYYAEYQVGHFSEFWINSGGAGQNTPMPTRLLSFTVTRQGASALLQWKTAQEVNTQKFVIEKSINATDYVAIGETAAAGNSNAIISYQFADNSLFRGINYYRLKMINADGSYQYSSVLLLNASQNELTVTIYPNPATKNVLNVLTSQNCSRISICDVSGRIIRSVTAHGFKQIIPLSGIIPGTYMVTIITDAGKKIEKLVVQ